MSADSLRTVFLSHSSDDLEFVEALQRRLNDGHWKVLVDRTDARPGDELADTIKRLIDQADHVVGVLSPAAVESKWVRRELRYAVKTKSPADGHRIVPLLIKGTTDKQLRDAFEQPDPDGPDDLEHWPLERLGIKVDGGAGALDELLPRLTEALLPADSNRRRSSASDVHVVSDLADLVLRLRNPKFKLVKNEHGVEVRRPVATASFAYYPPSATEPELETTGFQFVAPLGELVAGELSYYLERYYLAPFGQFAARAEQIEKQLPAWGRELWDGLKSHLPSRKDPFTAWQAMAQAAQRRFTVRLEPPVPPPGFDSSRRSLTLRVGRESPDSESQATEKEKTYAESLEAGTQLLALPWELLRDGTGYLFHDGHGVRVRRAMPGPDVAATPPADKPTDADEADSKQAERLRVLIVCARPESEGVGFIDHRVSVRPLVDALNDLGDLVEYRVLVPPTFPALKHELNAALSAGRPYHIVHFDGHGVYDRRHGLGGLVFEQPWSDIPDIATTTPGGHGGGNTDAAASPATPARRPSFRFRRKSELVHARELGEVLRNKGVGLFFLEACQSAVAEDKPDASVAGGLLRSGIPSVAAMSHSVLVETARRFTTAFYPELARGQRVGAAMLAGQRALEDDKHRGWGFRPVDEQQPGEQASSRTVQRTPLNLEDWFVPVLYQSGEDRPLLIERPLSAAAREYRAEVLQKTLSHLPAEPEHSFVGRSRELLAAERLLLEQGDRYVVFRGEGGEGKTTLAAELARWLVTTRRIERVAFVSVEHVADAREVLAAWGEQLVPGFSAQADSLDAAARAIVRRLHDGPTVLILDNMETLLPPPTLISRSALAPGSGSPLASSSPEPTDTAEPDANALRLMSSDLTAARVFDPELLNEILTRCRNLLEQAPETRLIITSREGLPVESGFGDREHVLDVGRLSLNEGMELVARVLAGPEASVARAESVQTTREEEIETLVNTVQAHARSLVLLSGELSRRGVSATTADLTELMADLEAKYPGDRERSLFASVELSLRRLPTEIREKLAPLGVFQGGGIVQNIGIVCGFELSTIDDINRLAREFVAVGLAELVPIGVPFLRFDPALAPALLRELRESGSSAASEGGWGRPQRAPSQVDPASTRDTGGSLRSTPATQASDVLKRPHTPESTARTRWAEACRQLAGFLVQQLGQDAHLAAHLTLLELPNLLEALRCFADAMEANVAFRSAKERGDRDALSRSERRLSADLDATPDTVIGFATKLERLLQHLNRRAALAETSAIRQRADDLRRQLGDTWTKPAFAAADANIDRLLDSGHHSEAVVAARSLVETATTAGPQAYPGADYDIAMSSFSLGRALRMSGDPQSALPPLATAREQFEELATTLGSGEHRRTAAGMALVCLTDEGDCLQNLGQLEAAAAKYAASIEQSTARNDRRQIAVGRSNLGTVRLMQQRYAEALTEHHAARDVKESLGESTAAQWHQIGRVHEQTGQWDEAEAAYLKSLAQSVESGNKPFEASSRGQLGNLYLRMSGRAEQAVEFHRQAADVFLQLGLRQEEGRSRNNAAIALQQLGRIDAARDELQLALECKSEFGLNAEPWTTWDILSDLETSVGHASAAATARDEALRLYESARRQGWQITLGTFARAFAKPVTILLTAATDSESLPPELRRQIPDIEASLRQQLTAIPKDPDMDPRIVALCPAVLSLLNGDRSPHVWQNPALDYADAVELKLLLEQLSTDD